MLKEVKREVEPTQAGKIIKRIRSTKEGNVLIITEKSENELGRLREILEGANLSPQASLKKLNLHKKRE